MEIWNLQDNHLITQIDSIAKEPSEPWPLKNTLKTLTKAYKSHVLGNQSSMYNRTFTIEIPREFDNLAQLYVKCTLTGASITEVKEYFATKIFKRIRIKTKNGLTLQTFTPHYLQARCDQVFDTPLYTYISLGMEPDIDFSAGSPTCFVPLFPFFSETITSFLQTRKLEQLEVEFTTNANKEAMGINADITALTTELYCLYHDTNVPSPVPRYLKNTYDIFEEDTTTIGSGSTSARLLLRCPHPVFSINMALIDANSNRKQIKTIKVSFADRTFLEMDYRINYQNYGNNKSFLENGTYTFFLSKMKDRQFDSGLIQFVGSVAPVYLDITFDALDASYSFYVFEEVRRNFEVNENGIIMLSDDIKGWREGLRQMNADTGRAFLKE